MANKEEQAYLDLLKDLIESGSKREDRTKTGVYSKFGTTLRFDLSDWTIPLLTTKKMFLRGIIEELLFFIRGERQTKKLEEKGINIWKGNSSKEFQKMRGLSHYEEGDIGPMYGSLWRDFCGIDQLQNCFDLIKTDPESRRIMITAYNPALSKECVLEPCHLFFQFYVNEGKLSLQWMQRSVDCFLGLPYNCASYAVLTMLMAKATNLLPGELIFCGGDTHLYLNHLDQACEQISREPYPFPKVEILKDVQSIADMEKLTFEDFKIIDYKHHSKIAAPMAI